MALHFDLTKVPDWEKLQPGRTECVIFLMMLTGTTKIVDPDETFARFRFYETLFGPICTNKEPITRGEVAARVGLHTNVSPMSKAAFRKHAIDSFDRGLRT